MNFHRLRHFLPVILVSTALLSGSCATTRDPAQTTPAGEEPEPALEPELAVDWTATSPLVFLERLKEQAQGVVVLWKQAPEDWVKEEHARELIRLVDSEAPAAAVLASKSSRVDLDACSTVGREALFLLASFREKASYPPRLSSTHHFKADAAEYRRWWRERGAEE
jgi:hypothetical protein